MDRKKAQLCKIVLASFLTTLFYVYFHFDRGYWAVVAAIMTMQSNVDTGSFEQTLRAGMDRIFGTAAGAFVGLMVYKFLGKWILASAYWLLPFVVALMVWICVTLNQRYEGFRLASVTAVLVLMLGLNDASVNGLAWVRAGEILLGVLVAVVVTLVLWPYREKDQLDQLITELIQSFSQWHETIFDAALGIQDDRRVNRPLRVERLFRAAENSLQEIRLAVGLLTGGSIKNWQRQLYILSRIDQSLQKMSLSVHAFSSSKLQQDLGMDLNMVAKWFACYWEAIVAMQTAQPGEQVDDFQKDLVLDEAYEPLSAMQALLHRLSDARGEWMQDSNASLEDIHHLLNFCFALKQYHYYLSRLRGQLLRQSAATGSDESSGQKVLG
jgi:uncharacterized membrane protein YccC